MPVLHGMHASHAGGLWRGIKDRLATRLLAEGTWFVLLGVAALGCTLFGPRTMIQLQGLVLLLSGLTELADGLTNRVPGRSLRTALSGALATLTGLYLFTRPGVGIAGATVIVVMFLFAGGAFRFLVALLERFPQWRWCVGYGVASIGLGIVAVWTWPRTQKWVLGAVVGAELLLRAGMLIAMGARWRPVHPPAARG
ncbi:MAG: DUF308 domain-containing protein [Myxococcaceae bacterium]|nr:DUF308 domain-containing protein [Myxococcaceae bacterium]